MSEIRCPICGAAALNRRRGRTRKYCSDRCRRRAQQQRRAGGVPLVEAPSVPGGTGVTPASATDPLAPWRAWAQWLRENFDIDHTHDRMIELVLLSATRLEEARRLLDDQGLIMAGRAHPALSVEKSAASTIERLLIELRTEEHDAPSPSQPITWPRRA